jgi:hypothetical protein
VGGNVVDDGYGVYSRFFNASDPCMMDTGVKSVYPSPLPSSLVVGRGGVGPLTARDSRFNAVSFRVLKRGRGLWGVSSAETSEADRRWFV